MIYNCMSIILNIGVITSAIDPKNNQQSFDVLGLICHMFNKPTEQVYLSLPIS